MKHERDYGWKTHLGNRVTIEGVGDEHLANTIQFVRHYGSRDNVLETLLEEAKTRGLTEEFLKRAPFPYKDGLGNWIVWDFETNDTKVVGSYKRG